MNEQQLITHITQVLKSNIHAEGARERYIATRDNFIAELSQLTSSEELNGPEPTEPETTEEVKDNDVRRRRIQLLINSIKLYDNVLCDE